MSTVLLVAVVVFSAAFCPLMMWWGARRGRPAPCCPPQRDRAPDVDDLRQQHTRLGERIAELSSGTDGAPDTR